MATADDKLSLITVVIAGGDRRCDSSSTHKNIARMRGDAIFLYLQEVDVMLLYALTIVFCERFNMSDLIAYM